MTASELIELVHDMRAKQKAYFRAPTGDKLIAARAAERAVDRALDEILRQPTFFGGKE